MPSSESPARSAWSTNENGRSLASVISQSESLAISTAIGFLSTPYRQRSATRRWASASRSIGSAGSGSRSASGVSATSAVDRHVLSDPGLLQPRGEVAAGGDEERAGAHRDVGDLEVEKLVGGLELPVRRVALLGGAGVVGDRVERVLDDLLGELARRVVGAGRAAVERLRDEQRPGEEDERVAAQVVAQQRVVRRDPLEQRRRRCRTPPAAARGARRASGASSALRIALADLPVSLASRSTSASSPSAAQPSSSPRAISGSMLAAERERGVAECGSRCGRAGPRRRGRSARRRAPGRRAARGRRPARASAARRAGAASCGRRPGADGLRWCASPTRARGPRGTGSGRGRTARRRRRAGGARRARCRRARRGTARARGATRRSSARAGPRRRGRRAPGAARAACSRRASRRSAGRRSAAAGVPRRRTGTRGASSR